MGLWCLGQRGHVFVTLSIHCAIVRGSNYSSGGETQYNSLQNITMNYLNHYECVKFV